jgi:fluoroacetyl-CoA thioesterase
VDPHPTFIVTPGDTALALGSGDLDVLATPRLLAWCESAACAVVRERLGPTATSVGTRVRLEHLAASPVGEQVSVSATLTHEDGRLLKLEVAATGHDGRLLATGEVTRVVVDAERFLARIPRVDGPTR